MTTDVTPRAGWTVTTFRRVAQISGGLVDPRDPAYSLLRLIAPNHIESGTGMLLGDESADEQGADSGKYLAKKGDILYSKIRPQLNKVTIAPESCLCSADMYPIHLRSGDIRFAVYWMLAKPFLTFASTMADRVKMPKINREELAGAPWVTPPEPEQRAIADFLDRETAKIDALIEKQNEMIGLLRERRLSTINSVLSQAPGVPGTPLRNAVAIQSGVTLGKVFGPEVHVKAYPYLRVANVQTGYIDTTDLATIELPPVVARQSLLRPGDVLITEGGDRAALARGSMWHGQVDPCLHQNHLYVLRPKPYLMKAEYLVYLLEGSDARQYFERTRRQTTNLSATNSSIVRAFRFTLPSVQLQEALVDRLDEVTAKIDALIAKAEEFIALTRERRAALITAAVTGQIDVLGKAS